MNLGVAELMILLVIVAVPAVIVVAVVAATRAGRRPPAGSGGDGPGPGRWFADPTGRHAQRWWDGSAWTASVVLDNGQQTVDPVALDDPPPPPA